MDASAVKRYLNDLHDRITAAVEGLDTAKFRRDSWARPEGGGGESRILAEGTVFERAGVSFSHVFGDKMPQSASTQRPEIAGAPFEAMGLSLVFHPRNPHAPTTHCNVRFLVASPSAGPAVWWFGGGFDLTPYYPYDEDVLHWHRTARDACRPFGAGYLPQVQGVVRPLFLPAAS
jgi:coproporphyrinogen III oxidase